MTKMKSFWDNLPQPFFALAPMEAVTDVVFRHVVQRAGAPDVFFTEFANATGWVHAGMTMRRALMRSKNMVSIRILQAVTPQVGQDSLDRKSVV